MGQSFYVDGVILNSTHLEMPIPSLLSLVNGVILTAEIN
jgi:hypothetical protein